VRGCDPSPGAWALVGGGEGAPVRLFDVGLRPGGGEAPPGTVLGLEDERLWVAVPGGRLGFGKLRLAGGAKAPAAELSRAGGLEAGGRLR